MAESAAAATSAVAMSPPSNSETPRNEESDPRGSLRHLLASSPVTTGADSPAPALERTPSKPGASPQQSADPNSNGDAAKQQHMAMMTTTTRRNANGSVSSVYSGNKIRYLKKDDGQPLWREDIQFLFLKIVFQDNKRVFTNPSDGSKGHTFAEIYIDTMAKSSKCSGILKDKLLTDHEAAVHMAMICLLVNVGRMNTTLNFFPEMRARVRTYHPIPSLQAHQSQQAYKQLQDGPRLKSILKGATEDVQQPSTIPGIRNSQIPRTNPVNLIFVLSQLALKVTEMHFNPPTDFFDLFMKSTLSSRSRANAFLWMLWWYLESDFSQADAERNPFGKGMAVSSDSGETFFKVPELEVLTEEQAKAENIDTEEEIYFGKAKTRERLDILANDLPTAHSVPKKGGKSPSRKGGRDDSPQVDSQRVSLSPSRSHPLAIAPGARVVDVIGSSPQVPMRNNPRESSRRGVGRGNYPRRPRDSTARSSDVHASETLISLLPAEAHQSRDTNSTAPNFADSPLAPYGTGKSGAHRRRPPTAHQQALDQNRRERVEYLLDQNMRAEQKSKRHEHRRRGILVDAWIKCRTLPEGWDSESDENTGKIGGLDEIIPGRSDLTGDVGERAGEIAKAWRRVGKALDGITVERVRRPKGTKVRSGMPKDFSSSIHGFGFPEEWGSHSSAGFALPTGTEPLTLDGDGYPPSQSVPRKKRPYSKRRPTVRKPIVLKEEAKVDTGSGKRGGRRSGAAAKGERRKSGGTPGQQGVPLDVYFNSEAGDDATATPISGVKRRARASTTTGGSARKKAANNSTRATASRRAAKTAAAAIKNKNDDDTTTEIFGTAPDTPATQQDIDGGEEDDTTMLDDSTVAGPAADDDDGLEDARKEAAEASGDDIDDDDEEEAEDGDEDEVAGADSALSEEDEEEDVGEEDEEDEEEADERYAYGADDDLVSRGGGDTESNLSEEDDGEEYDERGRKGYRYASHLGLKEEDDEMSDVVVTSPKRKRQSAGGAAAAATVVRSSGAGDAEKVVKKTVVNGAGGNASRGNADARDVIMLDAS